MRAALKKIKPAGLVFMHTKAKQIQPKMQKNRPWTDRTGMAKMTLSTFVVQPSEDLIRVVLAHGMSYGKWLELAHGRRWNILQRTIAEEGEALPKELDKFMDMIFEKLGKAGVKTGGK